MKNKDIFISKDRLRRRKTIGVAIPNFMQYDEHYPKDCYNQDILTIKECSKLFYRYPVKKTCFDEGISCIINFPFDIFLKRPRNTKKYAANFSFDKRIGSVKENDLPLMEKVISYKMPTHSLFKVKIILDMPKTIKLSNTDITKSVYAELVNDCVQQFFYDLFFVANIACPGSLNFFNLSLYLGGKSEKINLRGYPWYYSRHTSHDTIAPIKIIPVKKVFDWYKSIISNDNSFSQCDVSNALNSFIRFASYEYEDPIDNIFIIHAIEALYGGNIPNSLLKKRIQTVLCETKKSKKLDETIDVVYKWRHKLIHGGLKIPHPLASRLTDVYEKNYIGQYMNAQRAGFRIVLLSLQQLVESNAKAFNFKESLEYIMF